MGNTVDLPQEFSAGFLLYLIFIDSGVFPGTLQLEALNF